MTESYFWPVVMLVALMAGLFTGFPVAFVLAGVGILLALLADIPLVFLSTAVARIYSGILTNWLLIAIPLFVFMGLMMERSGVAERLLGSLASLFRSLPGGYAFAVAILGVAMGASTGIIGASVVLMGMIALPTMLQNRYDPRIATGLIASTGTLGILLPPSIMLIVLGDQLRVPIGDLFIGAIGPGLLLSGLFLLYLIAVAILQPHRMPPRPEGQTTERSALIVRLLKDLVAPVLLILSVLGTIIAGVATPTEAAAIGALGALVLAFLSGSLDVETLRSSLRQTTKTTAMIVFVMIGATVFSVIFRRLGGDAMVADAFAHIGESPYVVLLAVMALIFIIGFFLEWVEIVLVVVPIVAPVVMALDFGMDPEQTLAWFAIALAVNLQISFLTPPFGYALFYLRGIAPEVPIATIYRGIVPFVLLQVLAVLLVIMFPQISLGLASYLGR
ncbi:TRAP transporter large permease [Microbaculum sp. FT89]|uniref:TRAP transporter large permease n=1 Tax=Microbaculum sp. FT89 TaxID=3447298 RepID=UPI003F535401